MLNMMNTSCATITCESSVNISPPDCVCGTGTFYTNGECIRCPNGHYCPDSLDSPLACPVNAKTPWWNSIEAGLKTDTGFVKPDSIQACECVDGYFRADNTAILQLAIEQGLIETAELHDMFCVICPRGVFCTSKGPLASINNSSLNRLQENGELCPRLSTTKSTASISIRDCECQAGAFRRQEPTSSTENTHTQCILCENNHYCPEIRPDQIACPLNTVSAAGMMLLSDCFCLPPFMQIPSFAEENGIDCVRDASTQMYHPEDSPNSEVQTYAFALQTDMLFLDSNPTTCISVQTGICITCMIHSCSHPRHTPHPRSAWGVWPIGSRTPCSIFLVRLMSTIHQTRLDETYHRRHDSMHVCVCMYV